MSSSCSWPAISSPRKSYSGQCRANSLLQPPLQGDIGLGHDAAVELRMALHIGTILSGIGWGVRSTPSGRAPGMARVKTRQYLFLRELAYQVAQDFEVGKHHPGTARSCMLRIGTNRLPPASRVSNACARL